MENWRNRFPDESYQDRNDETHEISGSYYRDVLKTIYNICHRIST